jgi:hypothetical protein
MKRAICLLVLGLFSTAFVVGCHAEAGVDPNGTSSGNSHYEKKTTTYNDGTTSTKVETRTNP